MHRNTNDEERRWDDAAPAKFMRYWPVVAGIGAGLLTGAFSLGVSSNQIASIERRVDRTEKEYEESAKEIAALQQIVKEIPEIRRDIKEILRRTR